MDITKIKQKLNEHNAQKQAKDSGGQKGDNLFWKPKPGTQRVRIVPSPHNPDYPGTELFFYYEFGKPMLAPVSFGLPDPIVKFCNSLKAEKGEKEVVSNNWKVANKLSAKKRVFVPIIVRGVDNQPDTGPFYWGIAPSYYDEILAIMADEDYGDISDFERGRDLTVEYTLPVKDGAYPETTIRPRGNPSVTTDDADLFDRIKSIKNITEVYKCPTEQELSDALRAYVSGGSEEPAQPEVEVKNTAAVNSVKDEFSEKFKDVFAPSTPPEPSTDDLPF